MVPILLLFEIIKQNNKLKKRVLERGGRFFSLRMQDRNHNFFRQNLINFYRPEIIFSRLKMQKVSINLLKSIEISFRYESKNFKNDSFRRKDNWFIE